MPHMSPETYKLMLTRVRWDKPADVHYIQAIAADDPTLTNLYVEYVESLQQDGDENNS